MMPKVCYVIVMIYALLCGRRPAVIFLPPPFVSGTGNTAAPGDMLLSPVYRYLKRERYVPAFYLIMIKRR